MVQSVSEAPVAANAGGVQSQPKSRAGKPEAARNLYTTLIQSAHKKMPTLNELQGQYDCNPPESQEWLDSHGKRNLANFNSREFRYQIDSDVKPYFTLVVNSPNPARWETTVGETWLRGAWMAQWSALYKKLLGKWESYPFHVLQYLKQRSLFGTGPVMWSRRLSWQDTALPHWALLVPARAGADPDKWSYFMVLDTIPVFELVGVLSATKQEKSNGWDIANIKALLKGLKDHNNQAFPVEVFDDSTAITEQSEAMNNAFTQTQTKWGDIRIVRYFVKEYDGEWSEHIFRPTPSESESGSNNNKVEGYLYSDIGAYNQASDIICPNPYGDAYHYGDLKGLGHTIATGTKARDKLLNKTVNNVILNSGLHIQGLSEGDEMLLEEVRSGYDVTYWPAGLNAINVGFNNTADQTLALSAKLGNLNDRLVSPTMAQPLERADRKTAREAEFEASVNVELSQHQIEFFKLWEKRMHASRMRRIQHIIKHFKITEDVLRENKQSERELKIKEMRCPGYKALLDVLRIAVVEKNIPLAAIQEIDADSCMVEFLPTLQQLLLIRDRVPEMGEDADRMYKQMLFTQALGATNAAKYITAPELPSESRATHDAQIELVAFRMGVTVYPKSDDNHLMHAQVHLQQADGSLNPWFQAQQQQQGEQFPLEQKQRILQEAAAIYEHNMGEQGHMRWLERSPYLREQASELLRQWGTVFNLLQKLNSEVSQQAQAMAQQQAEAQQQAQQQPQLSVEEQAKLQTEQIKQQSISEKTIADISNARTQPPRQKSRVKRRATTWKPGLKRRSINLNANKNA